MSLLRCTDVDGSIENTLHRKLKQKRREAIEDIDKIIDSCIAIADEETAKKKANKRAVDPRNRRGGMPTDLGGS